VRTAAWEKEFGQLGSLFLGCAEVAFENPVIDHGQVFGAFEGKAGWRSNVDCMRESGSRGLELERCPKKARAVGDLWSPGVEEVVGAQNCGAVETVFVHEFQLTEPDAFHAGDVMDIQDIRAIIEDGSEGVERRLFPCGLAART
jgi:hypothetical protein